MYVENFSEIVFEAVFGGCLLVSFGGLNHLDS
jgi:hypothetical protein